MNVIKIKKCNHDWSFVGESSNHNTGYFQCELCGEPYTSEGVPDEFIAPSNIIDSLKVEIARHGQSTTSLTCYEAMNRITSLESHNRELLAVNQVLREAIHQMLNVAFKLPPTTQQEHDVRRREVHDATKELERAFSIKPGDIALVEVGYASEPSIQNLINGNDVIVGKKNDIRTEAVYALQKKEG